MRARTRAVRVLTFSRRSQVMDVNVNGVLFTAQAAGRQMAKFGNGGSIILIASMSGSITNKVRRRAMIRPAVAPPAQARSGRAPELRAGDAPDLGSLRGELTCPLARARGCTGSRVGVVQHIEIGGAADGAQHGLRAGAPAHPRQHAQPGTHLHKVRLPRGCVRAHARASLAACFAVTARRAVEVATSSSASSRDDRSTLRRVSRKPIASVCSRRQHFSAADGARLQFRREG